MKTNNTELTDEEMYQALKEVYKTNKNVLNPEEWKQRRLIELKHLGLKWSK